MRKLSLFALLLLGGCYATATPMFLPDGSSGYRVSCGDYVGEMADCIQKAGDVCGAGGYQMYDQGGRPRSAEDQTQTVIAALNGTSSKHGKSSDTQQSMFIKCKATSPIVIEAPVPAEKPVPPVPPAAKLVPPEFKQAPLPPSKPPVPDSTPAPVDNNGPIPLQPD